MQQAPQLQYGTFPCPHCGGELPKTMPKGLVFPCPYCQTSIESPGSDITADQAAQYQQWAMQHGAAAASIADQGYREQHDPANTVFASVSTVVATMIGGKPYFLGGAVAADGSWSMKLVDGTTCAVVWESLTGSRWAYPPDEQKIAVRGDRLFIAIEGRLHCLDLNSGRLLWWAGLDGNVETHPDIAEQGDELMLYDFPLPSGEGAVALMTEQGTIAAWGRDSGQPLWTQRWDRPSVHCVPGIGLILDDRETATVIRVFDGAVLAQWTGDDLPDGIAVDGRRIALHVQIEGKDGFDEDRVRIIDATTMQMVAERYVKDVHFDQPPAFVGPRLLAAINCVAGSTYHVIDPNQPPKEPGFFARLFGARAGKDHQTLAVPKMRIEKIIPAGPLVFFDLRPMDGEGRRLLGLDANTLQPRFDSGPLSGEPSTMDNQQVQTDGRVAVYVTAPSGDDNHCELRAIDTATGQERYRLEIGDWRIHHIDGEHLVVIHDPPGCNRTVSVHQLADGALVARNPFDQRETGHA